MKKERGLKPKTLNPPSLIQSYCPLPPLPSLSFPAHSTLIRPMKRAPKIRALDVRRCRLASMVEAPITIQQRKARGATAGELVGLTVIEREFDSARVIAFGIDVGQVAGARVFTFDPGNVLAVAVVADRDRCSAAGREGADDDNCGRRCEEFHVGGLGGGSLGARC